MKAIIIFLLMNYLLCSNLIKYVDISKYDQNDSMHLAIVVYSGKIDKVIYYGFSNENPTSSNLLSYKEDTTSSENFCTGGEDEDGECGTRYYFDIKKKENAKYLVVQCTGYNGGSIEFSFLPMSAIGFYLLYLAIFIVCVAICISYGFYRSRKSKKNNKNITQNQKTGQTPLIPEDSQKANGNYSNY